MPSSQDRQPETCAASREMAIPRLATAQSIPSHWTTTWPSRVRTVLASVLLITAFVVMLRIVPLPGPLSTLNNDLVRWILAVPNIAAKRAIIIGGGLGAIAYSMKIMLGIERGYMGKD